MKIQASFHTPILLIVFNRIETVREVFSVIRKIKPPRLYVAADGPRTHVPQDILKTEDVRNFINNSIDWNCEVKTLFSDANLGCKNGPATAIKWFFSNEEQGIVLEDDCLPDLSFFPYCQELLDLYKNDNRIGLISAFNGRSDYPSEYSYHLSIGGATFGWGSWQRVGKNFNPDNELLKDSKLKSYLLNATTDPLETEHICKALKHIQAGKDQGWDFSWSTLLKINSQLAIVPSVNLVCNTSINAEATHPLPPNHPLVNVIVKSMTFPLRHPPCIIADRKFSKMIAAQHIDPLLKRILIKIPLFPQLYGVFLRPIRLKIRALRNR